MMNTRLVIFAPAAVVGGIALVLASFVGPLGARAALILIGTTALVALTARAAAIFETGDSYEGDDRRSGADRRQQAIEAMQDRRNPTFDRDTGLCTNWYFRLRVEDEIGRAERYGQNFTVLCVEGSEHMGLPAVGRVLKACLRDVDYAGDYGDFIAVVLPHTDVNGAGVLMQRLAEAQGVTVRRVAAFPGDGVTLAQLVGEPEWRTHAESTDVA